MPPGGFMNILIQPWYLLIPLIPLTLWLGYGFLKETKIYILYWRMKKLLAYGLALAFVGSITLLLLTITGVQIYHGNISW